MRSCWNNKIAAWLLWALTAVFAAAALGAAVHCRGDDPVLLSPPEDAVARTEELMTALCQGDFALAQTMLYGAPPLEENWNPQDPAGALIWQAYVGSLDYRLEGELYPSARGVVQDVKFISMELPRVTEHLSLRARELLAQRVAAAADVSELYDENNQYRQSLVEEILLEAARQVLEEETRYGYTILSLELVCREGQWWALADQAFLEAVSGGLME